MAFKYFDRVKVVSTTTGTGDITLGAAVSGFRTFTSVYSNADTMYYTITDQAGAAWEVGQGTFNSGPNTLSRTVVKASSNAGAVVNFSSGSLYVFVTIAAAALAFSTGATTGTGSIVLSKDANLTGAVTIVNSDGTNIIIQNPGGGDINIDPVGGGTLILGNASGSVLVQPGGNVTVQPTGNLALTSTGAGNSTFISSNDVGLISNMTLGVPTPAAATVTVLEVSGTATPGNGIASPSVNTLGLYSNSTLAISINSTQNIIISAGNVTIGTAGKGFVQKRGSNARAGSFTLAGTALITVSNSSVSTADIISISLSTVGGTVGAAPTIKTITAATGFVVNGTTGDTSTYNYSIIGSVV